MLEIGFSKAKESELALLSGIFVEEMNKSFPQESWNRQNTKKHLKELMHKSPETCFCIRIEKELIGMIFCEAYSWWNGKKLVLQEFAIKKEFQKKGIGSTALDFLEKKFGKKISEIELVCPGSIKHASFYEKNGFRKTGLIQFAKKLRRFEMKLKEKRSDLK